MYLLIVDILGWIGALTGLSAYYLVTSKKITGDSQEFQLLNIAGAICLSIYTYHCKAYASVLVNVIWIVIGVSSFKSYLKLRANYISKAGLIIGALTVVTAFATVALA